MVILLTITNCSYQLFITADRNMWELALIVADREVKGGGSLSRQLEVKGDNVHKVLSVGQAGLIGAMLREYGQQGKCLPVNLYTTI